MRPPPLARIDLRSLVWRLFEAPARPRVLIPSRFSGRRRLLDICSDRWLSPASFRGPRAVTGAGGFDGLAADRRELAPALCDRRD